jgi:cyclic pyranopterin phosphate synthase
MVDVGDKPVTAREAVAVARVTISREAHEALRGGRLPKGDPLEVARIAGVQAAKRTADWIPLCHPLPLDVVLVDIESEAGEPPAPCRMLIRVTVRAQARTGVEMEALVGASAAALALYDMLKAVDRAMVIDDVRVESKRGGQRGDFLHPHAAVKPGAPRGERGDRS